MKKIIKMLNSIILRLASKWNIVKYNSSKTNEDKAMKPLVKYFKRQYVKKEVKTVLVRDRYCLLTHSTQESAWNIRRRFDVVLLLPAMSRSTHLTLIFKVFKKWRTNTVLPLTDPIVSLLHKLQYNAFNALAETLEQSFDYYPWYWEW